MELPMNGWDVVREPCLDGEVVTAVKTMPSRLRIELAHEQALDDMAKGTAVHVMAETLPQAEAKSQPWWRP